MPKPNTDISTQIEPNPKLEKRVRRRFTTEYKSRILQQADACVHGELGPLLRRENLYANQLVQWRREFAQSGTDGLQKSLPGPCPRLSGDEKHVLALEKQIEKLRAQLSFKDDCIALQKKALSMLDQLEAQSTT